SDAIWYENQRSVESVWPPASAVVVIQLAKSRTWCATSVWRKRYQRSHHLLPGARTRGASKCLLMLSTMSASDGSAPPTRGIAFRSPSTASPRLQSPYRKLHVVNGVPKSAF